MSERDSLHSALPWHSSGQLVTGTRYEFQDFAGASFTATFLRDEYFDDRADGQLTVLYFEDREKFSTNLPIRWREAE